MPADGIRGGNAETGKACALQSVTPSDEPSSGEEQKRRKVGLVLSGGGAKGVAHIGVIKVLEEAGIPARRMDYDYAERGGTREAALRLGIDEHAVVKSLVFDNGKEGAERRAVMVLMHGDERVSLRKLERLSGIGRLGPSSPDVARELTGYLPGGICPFGLKSPLPVFMQETLDELAELFVNAGRRGVVVAVSPGALDVVSPVRGDLVSMSPRRV